MKIIVNYLTEELTFDQITRLQKVTEAVISGRMDGAGYLRSLMSDFDAGGVGLPVARASEMAGKLMSIVEHALDVQRYRRSKGEGGVQIRNMEFINRIAEFISGQFELSLDPTQKEHFEDSIAQRIGGFIKRDEFSEQIGLSLKEGGVGLNKKQSFDVSRLTEKLIALGIPRTGEAHH